MFGIEPLPSSRFQRRTASRWNRSPRVARLPGWVMATSSSEYCCIQLVWLDESRHRFDCTEAIDNIAFTSSGEQYCAFTSPLLISRRNSCCSTNRQEVFERDKKTDTRCETASLFINSVQGLAGTQCLASRSGSSGLLSDLTGLRRALTYGSRCT